ncbi:MAG TPA: FHA domain-containing protein [Ktedonobacterales bacterium]
MMRCNQCRHELPDGSLFCDACGASLLPGAPDPSNAAPIALARMDGSEPAFLPRAQHSASTNGAAGQMKAPGGLSWIRPTMPPQLPRTDVTPATPLPAQPRQPASPGGPYTLQSDKQSHAGTAATQSRIRLRLMNGKAFELTGKQDYVIGRRDPNGTMPDVDLTDWNGAASGVSRQHAAIHVTAEGVSIEDLESLNETIRNGYRLLPHQRYPLQDGDELRLGSIALLVVIS